MKCPVCKKEVAFDAPEMPFCSKRCRIIDLGDWAAEKFVLSGPAHRNELEDEMQGSEMHESDPKSGLLQ